MATAVVDGRRQDDGPLYLGLDLSTQQLKGLEPLRTEAGGRRM